MTATETKTVVSVRAGLLKNALQRIAHVSKSRLETAASHLLLEVQGEILTATATDFDCWASIDVPVEVEGGPASVAVPTALLVGLVTKARRELIQIEVVSDSHVTVHSGGEYSIQGIVGRDYPQPSEPEDWTAWTMDAEKLRDGLEFVSWCRSTEEGRPILHGTLIDASSGRIVCTNGHALGFVEDVCPADPGAPLANVPPAAVAALLKAFRDGPVEIHVSSRMVRAVNDGCRLTFRLVEGQYPKYDQVIPKEHTVEALVDRRQLLGALDRAALFVGSDLNSNVLLTWASGTLVVRSREADRGSQEETIDTEAEHDLEIKFGVGYLKNAVGRLKADRVRFRGTTAERAALWDDGAESDRYYLVMPKRIID